jgi:hypothetical protein
LIFIAAFSLCALRFLPRNGQK